MTNLSFDLINALDGHTLATAESCTGGMIGGALTAVPGSSKVYKGGVISYTNEIKQTLLDVPSLTLTVNGAVSAPVAQAMAAGARKTMGSDYAISTTGLAGPGGDEFGNPVGTVYIGFAGPNILLSKCFLFSGSRDEVREQAVYAALQLALEYIKEDLR